MTDSILRSYYNVSSSTFVPFAFTVPPDDSAMDLLEGETEGFSIFATNSPATVAVIDTGTPANNLTDVGLDASNITQSGTSAKMLHHLSSPYVRWSPHNLFLNSGTPATQNVTLVTGFVYTYGITGTGSLAGTSGASGSATSGSPVTFTATGTTGTFTVTGSPTTMWINRGTIQTSYLATTGAIRIGIPHSYDAAEGMYALWVEPDATNFLLYSDQFDNAAWSSIGLNAVSAGSTTAPDGTASAETLTETSANSRHVRYQPPVTIAGSTTVSVYVKRKDRQWASVALNDGASTGFGVVVDLTNGNVTASANAGSPATTGSSVRSIGDGWYRVSVTATGLTASDIKYLIVGMSDSATPSFNNGSATYTGDGSSGIYVWGGQVEDGMVASSYIPTLSTSVTRATDDISALIGTVPFDNTVGTTYAMAKALDPDPTTGAGRGLLGVGLNGRMIYMDYQSSVLLTKIYDGAGTAWDGSGANRTQITVGTSFQCTTSYNTSDNLSNTVDGRPLATEALNVFDGTMEASPTNFWIGNFRSYFANAWQGYIYKMVYVPRKVADVDLPTWRYS